MRGHQIDTILLNIKKEFDFVPHDRLLLKLWEAGFNGSVWYLFWSYLSERPQCVRINCYTSNWLLVCSGVPQGSILGPLLFLVYTDNLSRSLSYSSALLFADETKISHTICSPADCSALQADLDNLSQ